METQILHPNLHLIAPFRSEHLGNDRGIAVWLPPSYEHAPSTRYPVLYIQDGMSVFDCDPRNTETKVGIDSWITKLTGRGLMQEIIVVAIDSLPDRDQEYSPAVKGHQYADFVVLELMQHIDQQYRTLSEPENTAVAGWSLGALISLYMVWKYPGYVGKAACLSTCFFDCPSADDGDMVMQTYSEMIRATDFDPKLRLYFDYGTHEATEGDISQSDSPDQTVRLTENLRENLLIPEVDFTFHVEKGGEHSMKDWRRRFCRPLTFLFPPENNSNF